MSLFLVPLSPRRGLIYLLLALAETAWLTALVLDRLPPTVEPTAWFLTLFGLVVLAILLGWLTEAYNLPFEFARQVGLALAILAILILSRMVLSPEATLFGWPGQFLRALIVDPVGIGAPVFWLVLVMIYVWWRCLTMGQTPPEPPAASFTLQIGFLGFTVAVILGAFEPDLAPSPFPLWGLRSGDVPPSGDFAAIPLILLFSVCSLLAVSLSPTETIAQRHGEEAVGGVRVRLANGGLVIMAVTVAALLLTTIFSFSTVQSIFQFIFLVIGLILKPIAALLLWFLLQISPLIDAFFAWLQSFPVELPEAQVLEGEFGTPQPFEEIKGESGPAWWAQYLGWGWRVFLIVLVLWIFYRLLSRLQQRRQAGQPVGGNQTQSQIEPGPTGLGDLWAAGKDRLAGLVGLARRFGLGRDLRAAVTIRRIYAALLVLAGQQHLSRSPSQTPTEFLQPLTATWPDLGRQFELITNAYINVHYGQLPEGKAGLTSVQEAWQEVYERLSN